MKTVQAREAKASLSRLLAAAERGEPTTITRHGKAAAVLVPIEDARKIYPDDKPDFVAFLLSYPGDMDLARDRSPLRDVDL